MVPTEDTDIWTAFDEAFETAQDALEQARDHRTAITAMGGDLAPVYAEALDRLGEAIAAYDKEYDIDAETVAAVEATAQRATLLADILGARRTYHESVVEARQWAVDRRAQGLVSTLENHRVSVSVNVDRLRKQLRGLEQLVAADKHEQLHTGDRVNIKDIEEQVEALDESFAEADAPVAYLESTADLIETFRDRYTADLKWLNDRGADPSVISISDRLDGLVSQEELATAIDEEDNPDDALVDAARTAARTHYEIARDVRTRRAQFTFGETLQDCVADHLDEEAAEQLRPPTTELDYDGLRSSVAALVDGEATTSEAERVLRVLRENDGSVAAAVQDLDMPADTVFDNLQTLLAEDSLTDLEAHFE